jgi:hypothetical protein
MNTIALSKTTIDILKNFSTINTSIVIKEGNVLRTISNEENILASATIEETFPQTFAIYDLNQFLSGLSLFDSPSLVFDNDDYLIIKSGRSRVKYYFSDPEITLKTAPDKKVNYPGSDVSFSLTATDISSLNKASNVYKLPDFVIDTDKEIILSVKDLENDTSHVYDITVSGDFDGTHHLHLKVENLRLMPGDYSVGASKHLITEWKHSNLDLTYYIALEP